MANHSDDHSQEHTADHSACCGHQRRDVLRSIVGMAGAPLAGSAATGAATAAATLATPAKAAGGPATRIDTHAHLWPTEYLDFIEKAGEHITPIARNQKATASAEDLATRFALMDQAGVAKQVLSATPQLIQFADAATCQAGARMINDIYADAVRQHADRFLAYGAVPLPHVEESIAEAHRCIDKLGFLGIGISTLVANKTIARDDFAPFYGEMNRMGAVVYIHPTGCGALSPMVTDFKMEWLVGAVMEDVLVILQLLKADIPYKYPNIKWHISHLGGGITFVMQRVEDNFAVLKAFPRSPTAELKKMWFDTVGFQGPALRQMIETLGSEHLILGSDYPYFGPLYPRMVSYIEKAGLPEDVARAIVDHNAARLYAGMRI